jgi:uncharacterized membrane protein
MISTLITVVIVLVILGLAVYLIETYIPMPQPFRLVIRVVIVIGLLLWLARLASLWGVG